MNNINLVAFIVIQAMILTLQIILGVFVAIAWVITITAITIAMLIKLALPVLYKKAVEWRFK